MSIPERNWQIDKINIFFCFYFAVLFAKKTNFGVFLEAASITLRAAFFLCKATSKKKSPSWSLSLGTRVHDSPTGVLFSSRHIIGRLDMVAWVRTRSNGRRTHWGRHILLVNFPPRASSTRHAHWIIEDTVKRGVNIGLLLLAGTKEGGFPSVF